jgi:hypothetical protein
MLNAKHMIKLALASLAAFAACAAIAAPQEIRAPSRPSNPTACSANYAAILTGTKARFEKEKSMIDSDFAKMVDEAITQLELLGQGALGPDQAIALKREATESLELVADGEAKLDKAMADIHYALSIALREPQIGSAAKYAQAIEKLESVHRGMRHLRILSMTAQSLAMCTSN